MSLQQIFWDQVFYSVYRYPWRVKLHGAVPLGFGPLQVPSNGSAHPNGGGFVADTAVVDASVYVGPEARVLETAEVVENARLEGRATVSGGARVGGQAVVKDHALVTGHAQVYGDAVIMARLKSRVARFTVRPKSAGLPGSLVRLTCTKTRKSSPIISSVPCDLMPGFTGMPSS